MSKATHLVRNTEINALALFICLLASMIITGMQPSITHAASKNPHGSDFRLQIPSIRVNSNIQRKGLASDGSMGLPSQNRWDDVALFDDGTQPGEEGSAVIAGHLDRTDGSPAVFWNLSKLKKGSLIQIVQSGHKVLNFHVTRLDYYPDGSSPLQDIFGDQSGHLLKLVTCAGTWNQGKHLYSKHLIVTASL